MKLSDIDLYQALDRAKRAHSLDPSADTAWRLLQLHTQYESRLVQAVTPPIIPPCLLPAKDSRIDPDLLDQLPDGSRIRDVSMVGLSDEESADQLDGFIEYARRNGRWWVRLLNQGRVVEVPARTRFRDSEIYSIDTITVGDPYLTVEPHHIHTT